MKKIISILLLCIMLVSVLAACANDGPADDTTKKADDGTVTGTEMPDIPSGVTFDGETISILTTGTLKYSDYNFEVNDGSYETVNESIKSRNAALEEKYKIKIETIEDFGTSFGDGPGFDRIDLDYNADESQYDICSVGTYDAAQLALGMYLTDLNKTKYIDLNKSWWDQKAREDLAINDVVYFTTGDISFVNNICTHMIMFNKELMRELSLQTPYELINNDAWDFDTFLSHAKEASKDMNGDGAYDKADRYGVLTWNDVIHQALHSSRQRVATINDNGYMSLTVYNNTTVELMSAYTELFYDQQNCFNYSIRVASQKDWDNTRKSMFDNGQALFYTTLFTTVPKHRDTTTDFGIIPYPKFTDTQEDYGHYISATHSQMLCVETMLEDQPERLEMVSMIIEDMAYMSQQTVKPAYYDDTLIGKNVRDDESIAMLDIIFSSRVFDVGIYYKVGAQQTVAANLTALLTSGTNNFASRYDSLQPGAQKMIDDINAQFESIR